MTLAEYRKKSAVLLPEPAPVSFVANRCSRIYAFNEHGQALLDFTSAMGTALNGFSDPFFSAAAAAQFHLGHAPFPQTAVPAEAEAAWALCRLLPESRVCLTATGAQAFDLACAIARQHAPAGQILSLPAGHTLPEPPAGAVILSLARWENGLVFADPHAVQNLARRCRDQGILLIADERLTGMGACGAPLGCMRYGIVPDMVILGENLAYGLPAGAVLLHRSLADDAALPAQNAAFHHNPVVCACIVHQLKQLADDAYLQEIEDLSAYLESRLAWNDKLTHIACLGMMASAAPSAGDAADIADACLRAGLILHAAVGRLCILPPLNSSVRELDEGLCILESCLL